MTIRCRPSYSEWVMLPFGWEVSYFLKFFPGDDDSPTLSADKDLTFDLDTAGQIPKLCLVGKTAIQRVLSKVE